MNPSSNLHVLPKVRRPFRPRHFRPVLPGLPSSAHTVSVPSLHQPVHPGFPTPAQAIVRAIGQPNPAAGARRRQSSESAKAIAILLASAAALVAVVAAAGFALDITVGFSIAFAAGIVGLFAHDYRRIRPCGVPSPLRRN